MNREQAIDCGGCGSEERWLLHNVRHRGIYRRLCTSCVLKFHAGSFCPVCFDVYEGSSLPNERIACLKCPSSIHIACVTDDTSPYICPFCSNPSFVFFDSGASNKKSRSADGELVPVRNQRTIDVKSAKVLVAAARIASVSMNKAATAAKIEAERRIKEYALSRKRAVEALERVVSPAAKEKEKGKETMGVPSPVAVADQKKKSEGNGVVAAVAAQQRIQNQFGAGGNNKFGVSASLNNVDSRGKERLIGFHASDTLQRPTNVSVSDRDKLGGSPAPLMGYQQLQKPDTMNESEKSSSSTQLQRNGILGEKENNGLFSTPPVAGNLRHPPLNNNGVEADQGKSNVNAYSGTASQPTHSNQDALVSKTNKGVVHGSSNMAS